MASRKQLQSLFITNNFPQLLNSLLQLVFHANHRVMDYLRAATCEVVRVSCFANASSSKYSSAKLGFVAFSFTSNNSKTGKANTQYPCAFSAYLTCKPQRYCVLGLLTTRFSFDRNFRSRSCIGFVSDRITSALDRYAASPILIQARRPHLHLASFLR